MDAEFIEFVNYVYDFYGEDGIYPENNRTKPQIRVATLIYLKSINELNSDHFTWGGGDSVDRERVRDIMDSPTFAEESKDWWKVLEDQFLDEMRRSDMKTFICEVRLTFVGNNHKAKNVEEYKQKVIEQFNDEYPNINVTEDEIHNIEEE
tara:strand:- start:3400 stop:3849 length:450 start_codon:yes stop_codon:yes gene_type:complete